MHENEASEKGKEVSPRRRSRGGCEATTDKGEEDRPVSQVSLVSAAATATVDAETIAVHCTAVQINERENVAKCAAAVAGKTA